MRHFHNRRILSLLATPLLAVVSLVPIGSPASALTLNPTTDTTGITRLGWSVVGLDSNNVAVGPDEFPVGARFCAPANATGVTANWSWLPGGTTADNTYIRLADTSTAYETITVGALPSGNCYDAYWNVKLTRDVATRGLSRAYQITFRDGGGVLLGSTDDRRRIYVEKLVSQGRNTVGTVSLDGGGTTLAPGGTYDFTVTGATSASYGQLTFASIFPAPTFTLLKADYSYTNPVGTVDQTHADACVWVSSYDVQGQPGDCTTSGSAGGNIQAHFKVKVAANASGSVAINTLIYDYSGSSFHYNSDFDDVTKIFTIAVATPAPYVITYDGNAGADTLTGTVPAPDSVTVGDTYTVESPTLTRTDGVTTYAFVGWNTQPNGTGNAFAPNSVITPTGNMTLYAIWVPVTKWALSYNTMGGIGGPDTTTIALTTESITVLGPNPTKQGYVFTRWATNPNGTGDTYTAGGLVPTAGADTLVILYAQWAAGQVALTYHANGGTGSNVVDTYTVGSYTILAPSNGLLGYTRTGYVFTGWNTMANGSGIGYAPGFNYTGATLTDLYAQWQPVPVSQYTVTYLGNGNTAGTAPFDPRLYLSGETATVLGAGTLARTGYTFSGWFYTPTGLGPMVRPGDILTITADVVLYARWTAPVPPPTILSLVVNTVGSGTATPGSQYLVQGSVVTITAAPASGWFFTGWSGDCSGAAITCQVTMNTAKTVTATFVPGVAVTTAVQGSGAVATSVPVGTVVTPGTLVTLTATPSAGWEFASWSGSCSGTTNPITVTLDVSKSCTAVFRQIVVAPTPPTATDDAYRVRSGKVLRVTVDAGVIGNDGASVTRVALVTKTKHGTVKLLPDGSFVYTPKKGYYGIDGFRYEAFDAAGLSVFATVRITVTKAPKVPTVIKTGR